MSVIDSTAKIPDGLISSNFKFPGNMYECMDVTVPYIVKEGNILPGFKQDKNKRKY